MKDITKSKDLTITKEFKPTPAMRIWIDTDIRLMTDNVSEIERESKITAQSWYLWIKDPAFIEWYNNEWNVRIKSKINDLDKIGFRNAKRDYKYWEAMQKRVGNLTDTPQQTNIQVNNFKVTDSTGEDIEL